MRAELSTIYKILNTQDLSKKIKLEQKKQFSIISPINR